MATDPDAWKHNALSAIREAEQATWDYFLALVRADLGPELAPHLDPAFCSTHQGAYLSPNFPWRLYSARACVAVRLPCCTELLAQYARDAQYHAMTTINYTDFDWRPVPWHFDAFTGGRRTQLTGKFAAVRYAINKLRPEEARVEPAPPSQWHITDNPEHARIAAAEYYKERERLEAEAGRIARDAQARQLDALRNITARPL
jgi:hypothetical protein